MACTETLDQQRSIQAWRDGRCSTHETQRGYFFSNKASDFMEKYRIEIGLNGEIRDLIRFSQHHMWI